MGELTRPLQSEGTVWTADQASTIRRYCMGQLSRPLQSEGTVWDI